MPSFRHLEVVIQSQADFEGSSEIHNLEYEFKLITRSNICAFGCRVAWLQDCYVAPDLKPSICCVLDQATLTPVVLGGKIYAWCLSLKNIEHAAVPIDTLADRCTPIHTCTKLSKQLAKDEMLLHNMDGETLMVVELHGYGTLGWRTKMPVNFELLDIEVLAGPADKLVAVNLLKIQFQAGPTQLQADFEGSSEIHNLEYEFKLLPAVELVQSPNLFWYFVSNLSAVHRMLLHNMDGETLMVVELHGYGTLEPSSVNKLYSYSFSRPAILPPSRNYYARPTPPDLLYEETYLNDQGSYHGKTIYEWNIDGEAEYGILKKLHQVLMYATVCCQYGNTDHAVVKFIINGFTGQLKGWWDNVLSPVQQQEILTSIKIDVDPTTHQPVQRTSTIGKMRRTAIHTHEILLAICRSVVWWTDLIVDEFVWELRHNHLGIG
ncbi:unnamed protein product [Camellia sinensis]